MSSDRISDVPVTMAGKQSGQDMSIHQEQVPVCERSGDGGWGGSGGYGYVAFTTIQFHL